jgi:hypothetical protein
MLQAPIFTQIEGVSIFKDDQIWYKFYPIAAFPTVRRNEKDKPVFLLTKYAFSDEQRKNDSKLPSGGGYLNFDIQFSVDPNVLESRIRPELQKWVDREWERRRAANSAETPQSPKVEFGEPTWTDGKVSLDAPQDANLVSARVASGAPSLLAGNIAVFSMDLTAPGATFMEKALVNPDGQGGTDLTTLQVQYDLKFWARIPPVHIHIKADSKKLHEHVQKIIEGQGWDGCTYYDFDHTNIDTETASLEGIIDIKIDTGAASLGESELSSLRNYALDLVKEMIESNFFKDESEEPKQPNSPTPAPLDPNNRKKLFKKDFDQTTMSIELDLEQSSVVQWKINPQATLETFFQGMKPKELKQFIRVIDLNDDFFNHLGLMIGAYCANYKDPALAAVEVQVRYSGTEENGRRQETTQTFTFTSEEKQFWNPSLIGGKREYEWRYRVGYKEHGFSEYSQWELSSSNAINVPVSIGRIQLAARTGYIDFADFVDQVQISIAYEDPDLNVPRESTVLTLNKDKLEAPYERLIYQKWQKPIEYKQRFILKSGEIIEENTWRKSVDRTQLLINQPKEGLLKAQLVPAGNGWDEVSQVVVDLRYTDMSHNYTVTDSVTFKSRDDLKVWKVVLQDKNKRDFEYQVSISYKSGKFEQSTWLRSQGSESSRTIPIEVKGSPSLRITIDSALINFATFPVVELTVDYNAANARKKETFTFRDKSLQLWKIDIPENAPIEYSWQATYYPADGSPLTKKGIERDTSLIIPLPPKAGKLKIDIASQLLDFEKTPMVQVDLQYNDDENGIHESTSLSFIQKEKQIWELEVKDISRKLFGYRITYFFADDTPPKVTEIKFQEANLIAIPKV